MSLSYEIKSLNTSGDYKGAMEVWLKAKEKHVEVDEFAYATVLSTFRHLQDYDGAIAVYQDSLRKGIRNSFIDSQIVDVYVKKNQSQLAIDLLYDMLKNGIEVKPFAFFGIMRILIAENRVGEALGMVTQHASNFAVVDKNFWPSLVTTIVSTKHAEACRELLRHVLDSEVPLPQTTYLALMHHFSSSKDEADVALHARLLDYLRHQGTTGLATLIAFYTELNDSSGALEVWQELKKTPKFFSQSAFTHLITVCAASGHLEQVEDIYKTMLASGHEPSSAVLAAMIRLYAANLRVEEAKRHFEKLLSQPSYISPFLFNTMLDMYAEIGSADEALEIVERMKQRGMKFNVSIYNSLIGLYIRTQQPDKAIEVYRNMKHEKVPLNFLTFRPLLPLLTSGKIAKDEFVNDVRASKTISEFAKSILKQETGKL